MQKKFLKKSHQVWSYGRLKFAIFDRSASVNTVTFFLKPLIFQPLNGLECCKLLSMYLRGQGIQKTTSQVAKSTASYEKSGMKLLHMLFISITLTPYKKDREKIWKMKFSKYIPQTIFFHFHQKQSCRLALLSVNTHVFNFVSFGDYDVIRHHRYSRSSKCFNTKSALRIHVALYDNDGCIWLRKLPNFRFFPVSRYRHYDVTTHNRSALALTRRRPNNSLQLDRVLIHSLGKSHQTHTSFHFRAGRQFIFRGVSFKVLLP